MAGTRLRFDGLGTLKHIASGGQGDVYRAPGVRMRSYRTPLVYKEYNPAARADLNVAVLESMPSYLESLNTVRGMEILSIAAWPCRMVEKGGQVSGFVMPTIPAEFYLDIHTAKGTSRKPGEFAHLLNDPGFLLRRGIRLTDRNRYELLAEVAHALKVFHSHDIAVGDLSPKNMLFSLKPPTKVYFIDCDAMRFKGKSVTKQVETPEWEVRIVNFAEELATPQSDVYKLGLLALRLLVGDQQIRDTAGLPKSVPRQVRVLLSRSLHPNAANRPTATEWVKPLQDAAATASTTPPLPPPVTPPRTHTPIPPSPPRTHTPIPPSPPRTHTPIRPSPPSPTPRPSTTSPRADSFLIKSIRIAMLAALVAAVAFDLTDGGPLFDWDIPLLGMVAAILALLKYSSADRRKAEALGLISVTTFAYWYDSRLLAAYGFIPGTDPAGLQVSAIASYGISAISALAWSALSFRARRGGAPPSPMEVGELKRADRATLRKLAIVTLTCVVPTGLGFVLLITSLGQGLRYEHFELLLRASPWDMLFATAVNGVWLPPLLAGLVLLVRGRWSHRKVGSTWAVALLLAVALGWPTIRSTVEAGVAEATYQTRITPVASAVVDGGRFCGTYWTQTRFPARTFIAGDRCDTLYQYDGWYESWSVDLSGFRSVDTLLSIDGIYIVLADRSSLAVAFSNEGNEQWRFHCEGTIDVDESQLDAGVDTPDDQAFAGTCPSVGTFRLDPSTGNPITF